MGSEMCIRDRVRIEGAPADAARYNNLFWGAAQGTGGSTAIANSWDQLRHAGAAARAMLVAAAARQWNVAAAAVSVRDGVVSGGGKKATFGELAVAAGREAVPTEVKLKDPKDFVFIGRHVPRKDAKAKSHGSALFTAAAELPGLLTPRVPPPPPTCSRSSTKGAGRRFQSCRHVQHRGASADEAGHPATCSRFHPCACARAAACPGGPPARRSCAGVRRPSSVRTSADGRWRKRWFSCVISAGSIPMRWVASHFHLPTRLICSSVIPRGCKLSWLSHLPGQRW